VTDDRQTDHATETRVAICRLGWLTVNSASHPSVVGESAWLGLRRGAFTCVEWQVTVCDLTWQVTLRSSLRWVSTKSYTHLAQGFNELSHSTKHDLKPSTRTGSNLQTRKYSQSSTLRQNRCCHLENTKK